MGKPESYAEAPQEIRDAVEQLIKTYGSDPALLAGAIVSATCRAILAAKAEEREACVQACETLIEVIRDEIAGEGRPSQRGNLSGQINAVRTAIEYILKRGEG